MYDKALKLWDVESGECILTCFHEPDGQTWSRDGNRHRLASSPEAHRDLVWTGYDPAAKRLRTYPLEAFPIGSEIKSNRH